MHGMTGDGDGMIVQRGFRHPPSLPPIICDRRPPDIFDVISIGLRDVPVWLRIVPRDRWAIVSAGRCNSAGKIINDFRRKNKKIARQIE
jgi:hypothetical protein